MPPTLAVVVCTYERAGPLADALSDLVGQLPTEAEVCIVDQSADPQPVRDVVHALSDDRIRIERAAPSLPAARNLGLARTSAPIVWFIDDDVRLFPGALRAHLDAYDDPRVGGVVGRIDERTVRPNARRTTNRLGRGGRVRTNLEGHERCRIETLKGCNMSFRRQALNQAGGFDPAYVGTAFLEDADASTRVARAGWQLWFEPQAAVRHLSSPSGGVRQPDAVQTEAWRFHNTGRFVRTHRGMLAASATAATFGSIAVLRAWTLRRPGVAWHLMSALVRGFSEANGNQAQA